jgi:hypothetical protein
MEHGSTSLLKVRYASGTLLGWPLTASPFSHNPIHALISPNLATKSLQPNPFLFIYLFAHPPAERSLFCIYYV